MISLYFRVVLFIRNLSFFNFISSTFLYSLDLFHKQSMLLSLYFLDILWSFTREIILIFLFYDPTSMYKLTFLSYL